MHGVCLDIASEEENNAQNELKRGPDRLPHGGPKDFPGLLRFPGRTPGPPALPVGNPHFKPNARTPGETGLPVS